MNEHVEALCRLLKCRPEEIEARIQDVVAEHQRLTDLLEFYETHRPVIIGTHEVVNGVHVVVGKVGFVEKEPDDAIR